MAADAFGKMLEITKDLKLKCVEVVTVNGDSDAVSIIINDPSDTIELLRRCHAKGIDVVYYPHPKSDDQAVVYVRG